MASRPHIRLWELSMNSECQRSIHLCRQRSRACPRPCSKQLSSRRTDLPYSKPSRPRPMPSRFRILHYKHLSWKDISLVPLLGSIAPRMLDESLRSHCHCNRNKQPSISTHNRSSLRDYHCPCCSSRHQTLSLSRFNFQFLPVAEG